MISRSERSLNYLILSLFAVFALYPLLSILTGALAPSGSSPGLLPTEVTFDNFAEAWELGRFGQYLRTSAVVSGSVVVLATLMSIMAGYAFGTMRFRGSAPASTCGHGFVNGRE